MALVLNLVSAFYVQLQLLKIPAIIDLFSEIDAFIYSSGCSLLRMVLVAQLI